MMIWYRWSSENDGYPSLAHTFFYTKMQDTLFSNQPIYVDLTHQNGITINYIKPMSHGYNMQTKTLYKLKDTRHTINYPLVI